MVLLDAKVLTSNRYDPRWFIWTTVFLFVVAASILTYITITSINTESDLFLDSNLGIKIQKRS